LAKLLRKAEHGQELIIARGRTPVAFQELSICANHATAAGRCQTKHKDSFDRVLIARRAAKVFLF
jgi:PIN domain nuclease of toxin-antitoxin system